MLAALRMTGVVVLGVLFASGTVAPPFQDPGAPPGRGPLPRTYRVELVASRLTIPWSLGFLPDGRMLFTERPGRVSLLDVSGGLPAVPMPVTGLPAVSAIGEGGLNGLAIHPDFEQNHWVYFKYTYLNPSNQRRDRVSRFVLNGTTLTDETFIVDNIPASTNHHGGRIRFGPDGMLYITQGETGLTPNAAQDINTVLGKILRVRDDGSIPFDNPFGSNSLVWSYGHRNPQGIDWDPVSGMLFETEHGPSGTGDEINIIEPGLNYGWPVIHERMTAPGMVSPILEYTPSLAPSGCSFYTGNALPFWKNSFFFVCLRGAEIHRLVLHPTRRGRVLSDTVFFHNTFRRMRDIITGPDGFLYFCTSNNFPGAPKAPDDDRILRIVPNNRGKRSPQVEIIE